MGKEDKKITKRAPMMKEIATSLGYDFEATNDTGMTKFLSEFKIFKMGRKMPVHNVIRQKNTIWSNIGEKKGMKTHYDEAIFDYKYLVSTGKSVHIFRQTVCMFFNKSFGLPHFYLIPEKWYHRVGQVFGVKDIDFVEYPAFSDAYYLRGDDRDFIEHTFKQPEVMEVFESNDGYYAEGCGYMYVIYKFNQMLDQKDTLEMHRVGKKLAASFSDRNTEWISNHQSIMKDDDPSTNGDAK